MEIDSDEQLKGDLSFDLYSRYAIIRDIIKTNRDDKQEYRILDVGGRGNLMQKFLPGDSVFYMDPFVETEDENYITGDGCDIPLEDDSFDFVVSSDVFEHIPPEKRGVFLRENLRVAKLGIILGAPFYSKEREQAEVYANDSYRVISRGDDHFWLKEHIDNGLPLEAEVEDFLGKSGYGFQKIPNNNLWLWELLLCSSFVFLAAGKLDKTKEFNQYYNEKLYPFDHNEDSYRTIYFVKKAEGLKDLQLAAGGIDTSLHLEAIKKNFSLLSQVYLEDRDEIEQLKRELEAKVIFANEKIQEVEMARISLEAAGKEIARIHASNSWKITRPVRAIRPTIHKLKTLGRKA